VNWRELARGEVAVVGLGASGAAAARLLRDHAVPVYASDAAGGAPVEAAAAALRGAGAAVDTGAHDLGRIAAATLVVVSPGVPPDAPPVQAARAAGVPVWAEAELGLRALGGRVPFAAITGTNGKTTTTTIAAHLLGAGGRRAAAAGNIGTPLCEVARAAEPPEVLAVELSSFQLHDMPTVAPPVGVLTNLAPDHLDRYPSLEAYYADKARLFANAGPASVWVSNADDPDSGRMVTGVPGRHLRFSVRGPADAWYDTSGGVLRLGAEELLPRAAFPLLGDHNVANALAAALAARALGVPAAAIAAGLAAVRPLAHRMEPVGERGGVLWINDSKATNVASAAVAAAALDRPFVLLLGGRHKGEPYGRLLPALAGGRCRAVVAFGEAGPLVEADLAGQVPVHRAGPFDEVLACAAALARPGDAVLLSPACSSYDMFTSYVERGERFRAWVEAR
jgi:UDP-N-acetylmuramoylalanine--D-glutamate ligase